MLSINSYAQAYVDACRAQIAALLSAYRALIAAARAQAAAASLDEEVRAFESRFCHSLALALDHDFDHRSRTMEGKDGNPLNELRVICNSIMHGDGKRVTDKAIRLDPSRSVTSLRPGDALDLKEADFARLADAVFLLVERRYA